MKIVILLGFVLKILPSAAKVFFGSLDQKVTLECGISTDRNALEWLHNDKRVLIVHRTGIFSKAPSDIASRSNKRQADLEIRNLKREDAGKFTCKADGKTQDHWLYPVSVVVTPSADLQEGSDASLQCEVHSLDQATTVKWQRPDGSLVHDKTVDLKPVKTSHGGIWTCEVTAAGGESFRTSLTISVTESSPRTTKSSIHLTVKGSKNTMCVSCTTEHQQGFPPVLGLHWWMWVAIGASGLILILLIISIVLVSHRARRKKMMKKAKQQQGPKKYCQCQSRQPAAKPAGKPPQRGRREKPSPLSLQPLLTG